MNILYATDENYAPICGVSIYSLLDNNRNIDLNIYIIVDVTEETKKKFRDMVQKFEKKCFFIEMEEINKECISRGVPKFKGSYSTYARLFLERYLPVERVLYIDCDTLIVNDLKKLGGIDMHRYPAGAVIDITSCYSNILIDRDIQKNYYNAGVMLIDLARWTENKCSERIMKVLKELDITKTATQSDQDVINKAMGDEIFKIPLQYNEMSLTRYFTPSKTYLITGKNRQNYYSIEEIIYAKYNPVILHFAGGPGKRPWYKDSSCTSKEINLWKDYQEKTPWRLWEHPQCQDKGIKRFFRNIFLRYSPWSICYLISIKNKYKLRKMSTQI